MRTIERDGIRFHGAGELLELATLDYNAGPTHLSHDDLEALGFRVESPELAEPSAVLASRADASAPLEPLRPRGVPVGGLFLAVTREGLDVYVDEYEARSSFISRSILRHVGLIPLRLQVRAHARWPRGFGHDDPGPLFRGFREVELAANLLGFGDEHAANVVVLDLPDGRVHLESYRRFRGGFSDSEARVEAEAGQADARARGAIQLCIIDSRIGDIGHFLLRRPTPVDCPTPPPEGEALLDSLSETDRRELIDLRRAMLEKSAVVRIAPWGTVCPGCIESPMRAFEYETDDATLAVQRCRGCGLELAIVTPPLSALTHAQLAQFASERILAKLVTQDRRRPAGVGGQSSGPE